MSELHLKKLINEWPRKVPKSGMNMEKKKTNAEWRTALDSHQEKVYQFNTEGRQTLGIRRPFLEHTEGISVIP